MVEILNIFWVEGWSEAVNDTVHVPATEDAFKALVSLGCESYEGALEFSRCSCHEVIYINHIVRVPIVYPHEDQYKTKMNKR